MVEARPRSRFQIFCDLFDESVCESARQNPLHLDEVKSPPSSPFPSSSNPFELPKPTKTSIPNQPWEGFCLRTKKTNLEDPQKVKMVNLNPHSTIFNPEPKPSFVLDTPNPQSQHVHSPDICHSLDDPTQDVDKSHLSESTSITTNLNETYSLDTSGDNLLHWILPAFQLNYKTTQSTEPESIPDFEDLLQLDSASVSSQDTSNIEIEFVSESEGQLDNANLSPTDVFLEHHYYQLFLLQKEIDAPYDNLSHQDTHVCEKQGQDDFLIPATDLRHNFSLPQFMAQHNCEDLKLTDTPSTVSTFTQASSHHTSNPICAHNSMATKCNESQYPTLLKQICAHNPSASQVSQANLSNALTSQYPPDPGEHVLKKSATEIGELDFSVKWFKFIYPSSKPRMTETSTLTPVHVAYSPIVFMNHQWISPVVSLFSLRSNNSTTQTSQ